MKDAVLLSELIAQLRRELTTALYAGQDERLRFEAGPIELSVTVGVERAVEPGAAVRLWVFDVNAGTRHASSTLQQLKITLMPRLDGDTERSPLIAGPSLDDER